MTDVMYKFYGRIHFGGDQLWKGETTERGGTKRSCALLVSKTAPQPPGCNAPDDIFGQIQAAGVQHVGANFNIWVKQGISDGDYSVRKDGSVREECKDHWIINVKTYNNLVAVTRDPGSGQILYIDPAQAPNLLYNGAYAIFSIKSTPYTLTDEKGMTHKGMSNYLQNILWVNHGERLTGGVDAEVDFQDVGTGLSYGGLDAAGPDNPANYQTAPPPNTPAAQVPQPGTVPALPNQSAPPAPPVNTVPTAPPVPAGG